MMEEIVKQLTSRLVDKVLIGEELNCCDHRHPTTPAHKDDWAAIDRKMAGVCNMAMQGVASMQKRLLALIKEKHVDANGNIKMNEELSSIMMEAVSLNAFMLVMDSHHSLHHDYGRQPGMADLYPMQLTDVARARVQMVYERIKKEAASGRG